MQLSIIIVNYRVRYFLEQCLHSVAQAMQHIDGEVMVIDNNSGDGSVAYLQPLFPWVKFIELPENVGFAKANNHGLKLATGDCVLFLNPDTIVAEDALLASLHIFKQHADVGALGIKMLDGSGRFLKESKRGFPSPLTSFYKLTGLAGLFPHSSIFARYYLGHLNQEKNSEVEVLAGAYMMLRKPLLDEIGGFDEIFFMYGEDIDLSYRVLQAGMKNYYLATSSIIHFKGESTRKGSLNYVKIFYQAMILFVHKHYQGAGATLYRIFLQMAIGLRAFISAATSFLRWAGLPLLDAVITLLCLWLVMKGWYAYIKPGMQLEPNIKRIAFPVFSAMFLLTGSLSGLYDVWYKPRRVFSAAMMGVLAILAFYSLLPEQYRFSRGIILVAGLLATGIILLVRGALISAGLLKTEGAMPSFRQTAVAGTNSDYEAVEQLLSQSSNEGRLLGRLDIQEASVTSIGNVGQLLEALRAVAFRDVIFVLSADLPVLKVCNIMQLHPGLVHYKMYYRGSKSIIGSDSTERSGEVFSASSHYNLAKPHYKRAKRIFDILSSVFMLVLFPVLGIFQPSIKQYLQHSFSVLIGHQTWVGYTKAQNTLPFILPGVLAANGTRLSQIHPSQIAIMQIVDQRYAADYEWTFDMDLLLKHFRQVGKP